MYRLSSICVPNIMNFLQAFYSRKIKIRRGRRRRNNNNKNTNAYYRYLVTLCVRPLKMINTNMKHGILRLDIPRTQTSKFFSFDTSSCPELTLTSTLPIRFL